MTDLMELAARCEAATGDSFDLNHAIAATLGIASEPFTSSLDAALLLADDFMLVALSDIAADGLTGCCLCSDTSTNPPKEHWGIPSERGGSRQGILARAVCSAALRARSASA